MSKDVIQFREVLSLRLAEVQLLGGSRELSLATTAIQSGRMRLGTVALLLGSINPYPQADNPASPEILPTADTVQPSEGGPQLPAEPVAAVKWMRQRLEPLIVQMTQYRRTQWPRAYGTLEEAIYDLALADIIQAKQWLGEQLAVIAGHALVKPRAKRAETPAIAPAPTADAAAAKPEA